MRSHGQGIAALVALLLQVIAKSTGQSGNRAPAELCGHNWDAFDADKNVLYKINVCANLPATECGGKEAAICAHDLTKNTFQPVGLSGDSAQISKNLLLFNTTQPCSGSEHSFQSSINLICGKTLGTPEFVTSTDCVHYFEWRTFTACKKDIFKPIKEVPCYVFDNDQKKHDLNPLIKLSGGYLVDDSDPDTDLFINVCRNIGSSDKETTACPSGSAACLLKGGKAYNVGQPKTALSSPANERLVIGYETDNKAEIPDFCNGHYPAVSITFICPSARTEGSSPKLTANTNCRYEIEWVTEYACHRDYLESNSCNLTSKQHDISVDLSPLMQKDGGTPYQAADPSHEYSYYLNVCGAVKGGPCTGDFSSCQYKSSTQKKGAGSYQNQTLRYSDGDLTLTYPGGEKCSSGFERMTVINFECNETAVNNGQGVPEYNAETDCTYFFTWETKYACIKEKEDLLCRVTDNRKRYDLSTLTRISEESDTGIAGNWEAVDADPTALNKNRFFINVCHKVLQQGEAAGCEEDAAICALYSDKTKNFGKFMSPPKKVGDNIQLTYSEGAPCGDGERIRTIITFVCKPGDMESPPVLKSSHTDGCVYEFEWHTAGACVLSKAEGDNCKVFDAQAGYSYDLSPLTKKSGSYHVSLDDYDYNINVCGNITESKCGDNAGVCQVAKSNSDHWNLGIPNSKLSYYDGIIQLHYTDGTPYQDPGKTPRSSLITFLCDRQADIGQPEYQKEDNHTYNFKWYTKYACPAVPVECAVVDKRTSEQYDLSRLTKPEEEHVVNWYAMDRATETRRKYYINVCRPLVPVPGCDRFASVCQTEPNAQFGYEVATISNLGVASTPPIIIDSGKLILEYTNGSECTDSSGAKTTYTTRIHLSCAKGVLYSSPRFLSNEDCILTFVWGTEAACPITTEKGNETCTVKDPNSGFIFNLKSLSNDTGYSASGNGKTFKVNICGPVKDCGSVNNKEAAGCEYDVGVVHSPVLVDTSLQLSTEGYITLTYRGKAESEAQDAFIIHFVCNDDFYPGELSFLREEINSATKLHDVHFEFKTALACAPAPVDCQVTDPTGNEYDLSGLSRDREPWIAVDSTTKANNRTFYLNVCKPLPFIKGCPGGAIGSCMSTADNKYRNIGFVQISPQASEDGSLTVVYMNGDICHDKERFSTRIIFQCDHNIGSPVFQEQDGCEFVFLWRTPEACSVVRAQGDNCQVRDLKYGYLYNLMPLGEKDTVIKADDYEYTFRVCGKISSSVCSSAQNVSSCQVKGTTSKVAGLVNQKLVFDNGLIMLNYTDGERCHNIYNRSTVILFVCDNSEKLPYFLRETTECSYVFQWPTPLACQPSKLIDCSYKDTAGNSYDLSPLSMFSENWEAVVPGSAQKYRLNVCKSLVHETGPTSCEKDAAACFLEGTKAINVGELTSSPKWENGTSILVYKNGDLCPDGIRRRMTTIRFKCDKNKVHSRPQLISALQECDYQFFWNTASACPLNISVQDHCAVTNPATGHLFSLSLLTNADGYSFKVGRRSVKLNICSELKNPCAPGAGVCISEGGKTFSAGKSQTRLTYMDQVVSLVYEDGDLCSINNQKHRSVFSFVCGTNSETSSHPTLVSFDEKTCTWYFAWHTSIICEEKPKCFVNNGTSLIDLTPLIKHTGYYEAVDGTALGNMADFYINICEPLNPVVDVKCPPGAAVCLDPTNGGPLDIGRAHSPPVINPVIQKVMLMMDSPTLCATDKQQNYSSVIIFHCTMGTNLGTPKLVEVSDCKYIFEWGTPVVCPDEEEIADCTLTDKQLQYTFNLSSLSTGSFKTPDAKPYYIGVCTAASVPGGKCNGAVCSGSGSSAISFGSAKNMKMNYLHEDETLVVQYAGGDVCPDKSNRESTILFKCDEQAGIGSPVLFSETRGCSATFEWKTKLVCLPRKLDCKFVQHHKTYDLRMLSSMTGSWSFVHGGSSYYLNLCQSVHQGPPGCSDSTSVCIKNSNGNVHNLGQVHTQTVTVKENSVFVKYSNGDTCANNRKFSTTIELKCFTTVGVPTLDRYDTSLCEYHFIWNTRAACGSIPKPVEMKNGILGLDDGVHVNLTDIYFKSYNATGDIRSNGQDQYVYEIQLSGKADSQYPKCKDASVCQIKLKGDFTRAVGSVKNVKYYINDDDLDAVFTSDSQCGKDKSKNTTATILFYCSQIVGEGRPEFFHETTDCQYLFTWYTSAVCPLVPSGNPGSDNGGNEQNYQGLSGRSQAVGAILSILLVVLVICLGVLLLYKKERRESVMFKITNCCRRSSAVSYKYTKISTEEEADDNENEWLMEEVSTGNNAKPRPENGHIKSVKPGTFTPLHVDDLDSEDEVLTVPEVRIQAARSKERNASQAQKGYSSAIDEKLMGIQNGAQENPAKAKSGHHKKEKPSILSFHDDSDEDMLNV